MGFTAENTLLADSSCPDKGDGVGGLTAFFEKRWRQKAHELGGAGGLPFRGKTGWKQLVSHSEANGNIILLFAPHVGINKDGTVGKLAKEGADHRTCSAAISAFEAVKQDESLSRFKNGVLDLQVDCIKHLLEPHVNTISNAENEMVALAHAMYQISEKFLDDIIDLKWQGPKSQLAILGGIIINCDGVETDLFWPRIFQIRTKNGTQELLKESFPNSVSQRSLNLVKPANHQLVHTSAQSSGYNSSNIALITINNIPVIVQKNEHNHYRGLHIVVINPSNGKVEMAKVFDTYKTSNAFDNFIDERIPHGYVVIAACKDDCVTKLSRKGK